MGGGTAFDPNYDHHGMQEPLRMHNNYVKIKDLNSCALRHPQIHLPPFPAAAASSHSLSAIGHSIRLTPNRRVQIYQVALC